MSHKYSTWLWSQFKTCVSLCNDISGARGVRGAGAGRAPGSGVAILSRALIRAAFWVSRFSHDRDTFRDQLWPLREFGSRGADRASGRSIS